MAAGRRRTDETFEQYRARLKSEQQLEDIYLGGWWLRQDKPKATISPDTPKVKNNESREGGFATDSEDA